MKLQKNIYFFGVPLGPVLCVAGGIFFFFFPGTSVPLWLKLLTAFICVIHLGFQIEIYPSLSEANYFPLLRGGRAKIRGEDREVNRVG